jgi:hypothetical protein
MDERLKKALEFSHLSTLISNQKRLLQEKFFYENVIYKNGGTFTINPELINFAQNALSKDQDSFIFLDDNNLPILIDNLENFVEELYDIYMTSLNEYYQEYQSLIRKRSAVKLLDD